MICLYCLLPAMESVQCSVNGNIVCACLKERFAVYKCSILTALLWYLFMQPLLLPGRYASRPHEATATRTSKKGGWVPGVSREGINLPFENLAPRRAKHTLVEPEEREETAVFTAGKH